MHRRAFVTALIATPLLGRFPGEASLLPRAERHFVPARGEGGFSSLEVEVLLAWSEREARGLRNREAHDPFDGLTGEFYIRDAHPVEIPDHLPGRVTTYETVVGVAAQEGVIHVGGFRRGAFVWTVRVKGGLVDYAIEAADAIAGFELPDAVRVHLAPSLLNGLLPTPGDFSLPVEIEPK